MRQWMHPNRLFDLFGRDKKLIPVRPALYPKGKITQQLCCSVSCVYAFWFEIGGVGLIQKCTKPLNVHWFEPDADTALNAPK